MTYSNYDTIGQGYARGRRSDPRIAARLMDALGDARSVLNVGAGAGSYEPRDRDVDTVDPSAVMSAQRPDDAAPVVQARAEALPFADDAFDATLAVLTLHHWTDRAGGFAECVRVAHRRVVLLTFDAEADAFWLVRDYFPEFGEADRKAFPAMSAYAGLFGPGARVEIAPVPVPRDCADGFLGGYWARPEAYLDPEVRASISSFARPGVEPGLERLRADLESGAWHARHGDLLAEDALDLGYRLVVAHLPGSSAKA
jgi:SAM-dependent methyltransferase